MAVCCSLFYFIALHYFFPCFALCHAAPASSLPPAAPGLRSPFMLSAIDKKCGSTFFSPQDSDRRNITALHNNKTS